MPTTLQADYLDFAKHFITAFAPEILKTYFEQVNLFVSNQEWLSSKCQYQIFQFFTEWFVKTNFQLPHPLSDVSSQR